VNQRLEEMEETGLGERHVLSDGPIAVEYRITGFGRAALDVLDQLREWAETQGIRASALVTVCPSTRKPENLLRLSGRLHFKKGLLRR
jgi:DNA-binding HxlR family transcriptional regulator